MKAGLFAINYGTCGDPEAAVRVARAAEAAGLESVWAGEHIVLPDPRPTGFSMPPELPFLDIVVALTLLAAETSTIRLGSGVFVLPQRNPLVLAKQLASADVISRGRLILGFGAGYLEPELRALGVPMERRGRRVDEYLRAMRAIWTEAPAAYAGEFVSFTGVSALPHPVQRPTPPILIGGESSPAYRRAVAMGQGWYGFNLTVEETGECLRGLREAAERCERPTELGGLEVTVTPVGPFDRDSVRRFEELGVDRLVLLPNPDATRGHRHDPVPIDDILRTIDTIARLIP
ncbi:MAG TPA: LLM class F420-dependent oxidoreductase [Candidatus Dormibacteraeota bacterium]|nr:LLM class F420-dependent oxidoreductase [Candidatus Dormibacteraeota bacterium]